MLLLDSNVRIPSALTGKAKSNLLGGLALWCSYAIRSLALGGILQANSVPATTLLQPPLYVPGKIGQRQSTVLQHSRMEVLEAEPATKCGLRATSKV